MSEHAVVLNLQMFDGPKESAIQVSGLAAAVSTFNEITVVAPPGTGKTTTLIQTAAAILQRPDLVPVFVPLGEWAAQKVTLFQSAVQRASFAGETEAHFGFLATYGRLVLVLDGWNEIDTAARQRLRGELKALRRDFPNISLLMSTRRQVLDVPLSGPTVEIDALSEGQQMAIATVGGGTAGASILDHAWRTPDVRGLVTIPPYLTALLAHTDGERLPTTKEEVLRLFVVEHERIREKSAAPAAVFHGRHSQVLVALAAEATGANAVTLTDSDARRVVKQALDRLVAQGQMSVSPEPAVALAALVDHHVLMRAGVGTGVSFQHQQFQEFYAAERAEELMRTAASGQEVALKTLREEVLNEHPWEESVLFACERLSRVAREGVGAVALAVREALTIDPMLAAEMIYRSSPELWQVMRDEVTSFARRWHKAGAVDRAFRFMILAGRAEFASMIWPAVSNPDDQVHLEAMRAAGRRFRVSVLGPEAPSKLRGLPTAVRKNILSEMVMYGGFDGIDLAAGVAETEDNPDVRGDVIASLLFRRATRQADRVLERAPDSVWEELANKGYVDDDIGELASAARLKAVRERIVAAATDPLSRLRYAVDEHRADRGNGGQVRELIASKDVSFDQEPARSVLYQAIERFPREARAGIVDRVAAGLSLPFRAYEYLAGYPLPPDDAPFESIVLAASAEGERVHAAAALIGAGTINRLFDAMVRLHGQMRSMSHRDAEPVRKEYWRLSEVIGRTNVEAFAKAILSRPRAQSADEMGVLAGLISRHAKDYERTPLNLPDAVRLPLAATVQSWGEAILITQDGTRAQLAEVAQAMERVPSAQYVPVLTAMLGAELSRRKAALEEAGAARVSGRQIDNGASMSWTLQYRRAFAAIGGSDVAGVMMGFLPQEGHVGFGEDAAYVLREIWSKENGEKERDFSGFRSEFIDVPERRAERQSGNAGIPSPYGTEIFRVVEDLIQPGASDAARIHALKLARVAVSMPYGDRRDLIGRLLALPVPSSQKLDFLRMLVRAGEIVPADLVLSGVRDLLDAAKKEPWLLDPNQGGGRIHDWLSLLPFSDRPKSVVEAMQLRPERLREPWGMGRLLSALGHAPDPQAEEVLMTLAQQDPRYVDQHEWFAALEGRNSASSVRLLLDVIAGKPHTHSRSLDRWHLGRKLAADMKTDSGLRAEVYRRFAAAAHNEEKEILRYAIVEAADNNAVVLLVRDAARNGRTFGPDLRQAIEHVVVFRRPLTEWVGAHELVSEAAAALRKTLLAYVKERAPEAETAKVCLGAIDEFRDEHGPASGEPRHPDISSDLPWPILPAEGNA